MRRIILLLMILPFCLAFFVSCESDTPSSELPVTDIAVLRSVADGNTVFAVKPAESQELELLEWHNEFDTAKVKVGDALLIRYVNDIANGRFELTGYSLFNNLTAKVDDSDKIGNWNHTPVYLHSYTVVDRHLVVYVKLPYSEQKRRLALIIDRASLDNEIPSAYLVHELSDTEPTFDRSYYISFDLSAFCSEYGIDRLRVAVNNSNLPTDNIIINLK